MDLIVNGYFGPGSKLPSAAELAGSLKISRSSIREALQKLETLGVVKVVSGSGTFVNDEPVNFDPMKSAIDWLHHSRDFIVQVLEVRELLEGFMTSLVADKMTEELLADLEHNLKLRNEAEARDEHDLVADLDLEFHELIAKGSGNLVAASSLHNIMAQIRHSNCALLFALGHDDLSKKDHESILAALKSGDAEKSQDLMREHLARVRNDLIEMNVNGN